MERGASKKSLITIVLVAFLCVLVLSVTPSTILADGTTCTDGHTWDDGVVTTEATCTEDGVKTYTCTVCGETKTEPIEAGHNYDQDEFTWTWTEDYSCVEMTATCTDCGESTTVEVPTTSRVSSEATCTEKGLIIHTASYFFSGRSSFSSTVVLSENSDATGHSYELTDSVTESDGSIINTYTCSVCGDTYTETVAAETTEEETTEEETTEEETTEEETTEEETTATEYTYTYYTFIDADGDEYLIVMRDDWDYVVLEEVTDGVGGVTWGYDVSDNGDGTYTLTKIDADASDLFHAEYIVYLGDDGIVYEVVDTEEETTEAAESDDGEAAESDDGEAAESDEEILAQTGDNSSAMVVGVASMGVIALVAGVLSGKRRKA